MPAALARRCVEITSRPDDVAPDPYAGSGTILSAAQALGRIWAGVELKPEFEFEFVRLIERRLQGGRSRQWVGSWSRAGGSCIFSPAAGAR